MFQFNGKYYIYRVCHFGAAWSAWWYSRLGAALTRLLHRVVFEYHYLMTYAISLVSPCVGMLLRVVPY